MRWIYENKNKLYILEDKPVGLDNRVGRVISAKGDFELYENKHKKIIKKIKKYGKCMYDFKPINKRKKIHYRIRRKIYYGK